MGTNLTGAACAFALFLVASIANAALIDRGGGLIYDTDLNITWLANADLAAGDTFGVSGINPPDGAMSWFTAQSWIGAMNTANYLNYSNWRLPTTLQPDSTCSSQEGGDSFGYACTGSEMGHLFYKELGGIAGFSILSTHNSSLNLFRNVRSNMYWSDTGYSSDTTFAWYFGSDSGVQNTYFENYYYSYAWAVLSGDVATVPVPAAAWLFGSGLLGLIGIARKRKSKTYPNNQ